MRLHRFPSRLFAGLVLAWLIVMGLEIPLNDFSVLEPLDHHSAHLVVGTISRAFNQLVSVVFLSVAVAIPITATNYTPKLLRLFLTDRIHLTVLTTYALAALHTNWVMWLVREGHVSQWLVLSTLFGTMVGFIFVVPYFFYVIWFLEPSTLVTRIRALGFNAVRGAQAAGPRFHQCKTVLSDSLHNLGSLTLKAVAGSGRQMAAQGILAMREVLREYGAVKTSMHPEWFLATKAEFRGLSREALQFISADRCWAEIVALQDLNLVFEASLKQMPDAVVSLSDTMRGIGIDAHERGDVPVVDNVVRAFNSMIRSAINHREPHAIFDVLNQYRALAEECMETRPDMAVQVAHYLSNYSLRARAAGLAFIPELFLYDLGALLRVAVEAKSSATHELLDAYIALLNRLATEATVPLACAYLVTLGSVHEDIDGSEREKLETGIDVLSKSVLKDGLAVLDHTESPRYHELTARQIDLNFLAPQLVEEVRETIARRYARPTTKRKRSEFGKPLIGS